MTTVPSSHLPPPPPSPLASPSSPPWRRAGVFRSSWALAALAVGALCAGACGSDATKNNATARGLAIVASDFAVTSVSLYDPAKGTVVDDCVVSGGGLTQDLSGDVTLPSHPQHSGELMVIDRKNATLTAIEPLSCAPLRQFSVSTGGFKANPHDVISVSLTKAYVTRFEKNGAATDDPADFDDGDDVLVVNPTTGQILKSIVLTQQVPPGFDAGIQARPDRGVLVGGKLYVTLGNLDNKFPGASAPGRIVVIDTATDTVSGVIDLPDHKSCSAIDYQAASKRLYVSCGGVFSDGADQPAKSGLVEIDLAGATPAIGRVIAASAVGGQPVNFFSVAVLGETAFVTTLGTFADPQAGLAGTPDALYAADLGGGTPVKVLDGGAYNFGRAAVDGAAKKIYLPDGDAVTPVVRVFDAAAAPVVAGAPFESNPAGHLPPREIAWY
ncbi:MAG: hypothetical protein ABUL77_03065 [Bacteroidota bacterium]